MIRLAAAKPTSDGKKPSKSCTNGARTKIRDSFRHGFAASTLTRFDRDLPVRKTRTSEKIGTRFHTWVRDNSDKLWLDVDLSQGLRQFLDGDFRFFLNAYFKILEAQNTLTSGLEHIYYIHRWGIASSLSFPLLMAPLTKDDDEETVTVKLNLVARYIETFAVRRSVNYRRFAASSIRYTMYTLVKEYSRQECLNACVHPPRSFE